MTSSNIRSNKRLLMFSALIAFAYSFPTETESGNGSLLKNASEATGFTDSKKSTMVHVEEKIPESGSVVVEFIYNGNNDNSVDSKGTDKDKYVIDSQVYGVSDGKTNSNKDKTLLSNQKRERENPVQAAESKKVTSFKTDANTGTISLSPEENSSISGKWPKYFYDVFNPIQPFPELEYRRPNQIDTKKIQSELANAPQSYIQEKKVPLDVAGPPLSPLSIYDREFRIPIFD